MRGQPGKWLRQRELPRRAIGADLEQRELAALAGIEHVEISDHGIKFMYDLRTTCLEQIAATLAFDTRGLSFLERMHWALAFFRESIHLEDLNYPGGWDNIVRTIYLTHYHARDRSGPEMARGEQASVDEASAQARENDDG